MELQWNSMPWTYLKSNVHQVINQEQTLEVRLSDGMPDIGRVLCARSEEHTSELQSPM